MFSNQFVALVLCILPALAAPSPLVPVKKTTDAIPGRYIVTFKDSVSHLDSVSSVTSKIGSQSRVTHEWGVAINGLAGAFTDADLELLKSNPNIVSIEDGYAHTQSIVTQTDATWGLGRITSPSSLTGQDPNALTYTYKYDSSVGANSDVYVIDTGGYPNADGNSHGTYCAGIAISDPYGVAKAAHAIAVKVLSDSGSGSLSDIISGMNWVASTASTTGRRSVALMAFGGSFSTSVNTAANNLVATGVTTVVAAGNSNADASNFSPASASSVITVGASDINDFKASFSNFGSVVTVWAPGVNIISTWNNGGTNTLSGTSPAASYIAGYVAYLLTLNPSLTPADVKSMIQSQAANGILSVVPPGTTNLLLNNPL